MHATLTMFRRGQFSALQLPDGVPATSNDIIAALNEHLVQVLQELSLKDEAVQKLTAEFNVRLWVMQSGN